MPAIRPGTASDMECILDIYQSAFPGNQGIEIAYLAAALMKDPTAQPCLSLVAEQESAIAGHILFTRVQIPNSDTKAAILCPLAVAPQYQLQGLGSALIREGLRRLAEAGTSLVFVLGHIEYYPRHGFRPAGVHGLEAPYPIPPEYADGWMVLELVDGTLARVKGTVQCAHALHDPRYWVE